jgi:aquaporin related protein
LVFGLSLAVSVLQFGQSYMNPMIALCQGFVGEIAPVRVINVITAEIVGAIAASGLVWALTGEIRGHVALGAGTSVTQGLFIETVAAATLAYLVLLITHEKHNPIGALAPLTVGFALTSLELFTIPYTSGSLNFARAIGPSIVSGKFHGYEWIYFVSNILGAISATAYYRFVRAVQVSPKTEALYGPALALPVRNI